MSRMFALSPMLKPWASWIIMREVLGMTTLPAAMAMKLAALRATPST